VFFTSDELWDPSCLDFKSPQQDGIFEPHDALFEDDRAFESFDPRVQLNGTVIHPNDGDEFPEHFVNSHDKAHVGKVPNCTCVQMGLAHLLGSPIASILLDADILIAP
jgi:hypothetical protein